MPENSNNNQMNLNSSQEVEKDSDVIVKSLMVGKDEL
jgi:hypothetical protein